MMRDRVFALLALAALAIYAGIVAIKVGRADLAVLTAAGLALAVYDIWSQLFARRR